MLKVLLLADFFPVEYVLKDPELQEILASIGDDVSVEVLPDPLIQNAQNPMAVIRGYEKQGIAGVEPDPAILAALADKDVLLVHWSPVNKKVIDAGHNLKFIGSLRSGIENVDKAYAESKGITVRNCPGRLANSVADLALALILEANKALSKRNLAALKGDWPSSKDFQTRTYRPMCMLTAGLVGFGAIAQKVAERLKGFGTKVQAYDPFAPQEAFDRLGVKRLELDELLKTSDIISLHARVTEETKGMIGREQFALMQKHCIFVNTARADLVDEPAMIDALRNRQIACAGLDVYAQEPLPKDSPLLALDNVVLTPHIGGAFPGMVPLSLSMIVETLKEYLNR